MANEKWQMKNGKYSLIRVPNMIMNTQTKIYIGLAIAAIFALGILGGAALSDYKIHELENAVENAKGDADQKQQLAAAKETEAAQYKQKIEYLEQQLAEIQTIARKQ